MDMFQQLGEILLRAVPTIFFVIVLQFYLKSMFFKPLEKVLHERYLATEGARKAARESLERAEAKTSEYEAKIREVRNQIYLAGEQLHKQLQDKETADLTAARHRAEELIREAREQLARDTEAAKASLSQESESLATEIADALLRRSAA